MDKLRIALCITDLDMGGAEQCLVELATRLDPARLEPVVYCLGPRPCLPEASCAIRLERSGVPLECLGARGPRHILRVVGQLRRLLATQRPHLVQTFLFHANIAGRLAAYWAGVRHVVCSIRVAEHHSRWHLWIDRLTASLVQRYVCVSQAVAEFSRIHARLPPQKLVVIPNGIDTAAYPARSRADLRQWGIGPADRTVTFVGRLEPQKGLRWLLKTAPLWLDRLVDAHLLIVGKGPEEKGLKGLCWRLGIASRVHFAGWRADVPEILAASQLLVLPSRWEGMPNVVLQAMATGLPVLATDAEGVRELLGEQADAQIVPYGRSQQFADRLVAIMSDPQQAAELGRLNRREAESRFRLEGMVRAYQGLWESLLAE